MVLAADAAIGSIAVHCDVTGDGIGTSSWSLQGYEMTTLNLLDIKI